MMISAERGLSEAGLGLPEAEPNLEISEAERTREAARDLRFELLKTDWEYYKEKYIDSIIPKSAQILGSRAANYIGPLGFVKMNIEAATGTTFVGQKLTPLGRINHVIIQGLNAYAHYLPFDEGFGPAFKAYAASWAVDSVQYYPEIISALSALAKRGKMPTVAAGLGKLEKILDKTQVRKLFFKEDTLDEQKTKIT